MTTWMLAPLLAVAGAGAAPPPSAGHALPALAPASVVALPALDAEAARARADLRHALAGGPLPYGEVVAVGLRLASADAGEWHVLGGGRVMWRAAVSAPGALSIDLGFRGLRLPPSAQLWVHNDSGDVLGPFDRDDVRRGRLYTPVLAGDSATIEVALERAERDQLQLVLDDVAQGYRSLDAAGAPSAKSLSCNIDVACPAADPWRAQVNSVARYTFREGSQSLLCTGQLMVDASGSIAGRLFSTADHCISSDTQAETTVFYWLYQSPTCRTPGSSASGTPLGTSISAATQSGARLLARHVDSDFTLLQLDDPVPDAAFAYYSGWDRVSDLADVVASIHHPSGHEKRISVEFDDVVPTTTQRSFPGGPSLPAGHGWNITGWDEGTTEGGSSGAGLWNEDARLIGVLSGGSFGCGNFDVYGRLKTAWEGDGTPATRMRDWLDPAGTGATVVDGRFACAAPEVTLTSSSASPAAGEVVVLQASVAGDTSGLAFSWDLDGDGIADRIGDTRVDVSFPTAGPVQVRATVSDGSGCAGSAVRTFDVRGPVLSATGQPAQQLCGDDDAIIDPGERWRLPVQLRNDGSVALANGGRALFVPADPPGTSPADAQGYTFAEDGIRGCDYDFVDIASGANAVAPLPTSVFDGNSFGPLDDARITTPVALQPGVRLYGQEVTQAIVSTNGYISFASGDSGADYTNACGGGVDRGSIAPRLHVLHDDLLVGEGAADGIRHRYFASCPRPGDAPGPGGCHVFQWSGMQQYDDAGFADGDFEFQALLYPGSSEIVYQYRSAAPDNGAGATVGLVAATPAAGVLDVACPGDGAAPATAGSAVCIYAAAAQPVPSPLLIEQPAPPLTPGAGSTTTVQVDFAVSPDATCGAPIEIDFLGAASANQSAPAAQRVLDARLGNAGACSVTRCAAQLPVVDERYGLFFQASRPGNGLLHFVIDELEPDAYAGIWYTAFADRTPAWYTVEGLHDGSLGRADLWQFTNTAAPAGFAPEGAIIGRGYVAQPASDALVFAWAFDDGRRGIELLESIGLPFSTPNRTQLWYAPTEGGWGHGVESNRVGGADNEFWATFLYDAQGIGRWVSGASLTPDAGIPLLAQAVHCPGCPYLADQLDLALPAGTLMRTWTGPGSGILDTAIVLPPPLSGSWLRNDLPITTIGPIEPAAGAQSSD